MAGKGRIRLEDAVGRRVIARSVHGIRTGFVQRRREANIPCSEARNGDFFRHDVARELVVVTVRHSLVHRNASHVVCRGVIVSYYTGSVFAPFDPPLTVQVPTAYSLPP